MEILAIVGVGNASLPPGDLNKGIEIGTVEFIGKQMYTSYLFPFEVTSILLLAAIVGAVILAKKKLD
jgi:NADH-quinone oxidoreductase subunit J